MCCSTVVFVPLVCVLVVASARASPPVVISPVNVVSLVEGAVVSVLSAMNPLPLVPD